MQAYPSQAKRKDLLDSILMVICYTLGLLLWCVFLNWGDFPYQYHDWSEVNMPRLAAVQDGLRQNDLPLHLGSAPILRCGEGCDRYFSAVDVIFSPQLIFLRWLPLGKWVLFHIILLYSLGFWGLAFLRRRLGLVFPIFALTYFLLFFNGNIIAHLSVGHITWAGYFLFPWLIYLIDRFLAGDNSWKWVLSISLLLFIIFLQGAFHQFVWSLLFLGILGISYFRRFFTVLKALVFACLVSAFRLLPPALSYNGFDRDFYGGYPSLFAVYEALTHWVPPAEAMPFMHQGSNLGYWEFDLYIGKFGLAVVLIAGLFWLLAQVRAKKFDRIIIPALALALLSYGQVYLFIRQLPVPLLGGERVTTRMLVLPFIFFVVYALYALQKEIARLTTARWSQIAFLAAVSLAAFIQAYTQITRLLAWRVTEAAAAFPFAYTDLAGSVVANHPDPVYTTVLMAGLAISLLSIAALVWLALRENRTRIHPLPAEYQHER